MFVKEIDATELSELLANPGDKPLHLIDVRTPEEFAAGIIENGRLLPLNTLPLRLDEVPNDEQVIFYCRTGARSAQACMFMAQKGYSNVLNLRGGIVNWARVGLPVVKPAS